MDTLEEAKNRIRTVRQKLIELPEIQNQLVSSLIDQEDKLDAVLTDKDRIEKQVTKIFMKELDNEEARKKFHTQDLRLKEIKTRLFDHSDYQEIIKKEKNIKSNISLTQKDIEVVKMRFRAYVAIADMISAGHNE